jgi:hypothetical protein
VDTRDELFWHIFNAARHINGAAFLHKFTHSIVEQVRMCIKAIGGHFERLLN